MRFSILEDDYPLTMQESMALVDRAEGFGTLDSWQCRSTVSRWKRRAALEGEVREHFEKLYESLWRQVLGVATIARAFPGKAERRRLRDAQAGGSGCASGRRSRRSY